MTRFLARIKRNVSFDFDNALETVYPCLVAPNNLLCDPIFTVQSELSPSMLSLPGVLSLLSSNHALEFLSLRAHQQHAWYAALVQLGALAMLRVQRRTPMTTEKEWHDALLALTDFRAEAFCLVVKDLSKPAFFQCPVPEETLDRWEACAYPDTLDVPVVAKNHDCKIARMTHPSAEHWVYMLASLQTMQGFWGRSHYGVARMNGGYASRSCVTFAKSERLCDRFRRDITVVLEQRKDPRLAKRFDLQTGLALLWLDPWNGRTQRSMRKLDPLFIEACSRIRMVATSQGREARITGSLLPHIDIEKGDTSDPWVPIRRSDRAAFTLKGSGFHYATVCDLLLSEEWEHPPSLTPRDDDGMHGVLIFQGMVRGQGQTEGYHQRILPVNDKIITVLRDPIVRADCWTKAKEMMDVVQVLRLKVLKPALLCLLQGAPDRLQFEDKRADALIAELSEHADRSFFDVLFQDAADTAVTSWIRCMVAHAERIFRKGIQSFPVPMSRQHRSIAVASRSFYGSLQSLYSNHLEKIDQKERDQSQLRRQARANMIANALHYQTSAKDLGYLRRLDSDSPDLPHFRSIYEQFIGPLDGFDPSTEGRWRVILRAMALLSGMHRATVRLGFAMARAGIDDRRAQTLLMSTGSSLHDAMNVVCRALAQRGMPFNHGELVELILSDGHDSEPTELSWSVKTRRQIARDFYSFVSG